MSLGDLEERLERRVAKIDDLVVPSSGDQPVEQRHLAVNVGDVRGRGNGPA